MSSLTATHQTRLRTFNPHERKTYLTPIPMVAVLRAQVNDASIAMGEEDIVYDSGLGTAAEYALITADMTLMVSDTAHYDDNLGRVRVKSITGNQTSGTVTVAWNNDVQWENNAYLTIVFWYELWPKHPRFTVSPEVFYKDKDVAWVSENAQQPPVVIMGPGGAWWLVSGSKTIVLDATNSYGIKYGATISSYAWSVATAVIGASPSIAAAAASSTTLTVDAAGLYWLTCTITDSNGITTTSRRPLYFHDSSDLPYYVESLQRSSDYYGHGGCRLSWSVHQSASLTEIPDYCPVIAWSDEDYNGTADSISMLREDQYQDRTHVEFFGYMDSVRMEMSPDGTGEVQMEAVTVDGIMARKFQYPVALIADASITGSDIDEWWKFRRNRLTAARAVHHLWEHHSTLHGITDVHYPTSDTRLRAGCEEFTEGSLMDRARTFMWEHAIFSIPQCDHTGCLYADIDAQMLDDTARNALTETVTLATTDTKEATEVALRMREPVAMGYMDGGNYDGNRYVPLLAKWGSVANNEGAQVLRSSRVMAASQTEINELLGRLVAVANSDIEEVRFQMAGAGWANAFDVVPQQWTRITLTGTETGNHRGIALANVRAVPRQVLTTFNVEPGCADVQVIFQVECTGRDAVTGDYPDGDDDGGYGNYPDPLPPLEPPRLDTHITSSLLAGDSANGVWIVLPEWSDWEERNDGRTGTDIATIQLGWDPWWFTPFKANSGDVNKSILFDCQEGKIWRSEDGGQTWYEVTPTTDPADDFSQSPIPTAETVTYVQRVDSIHVNGWHLFSVEYYDGSTWGAWLLETDDDALTWTWHSIAALAGVEDCDVTYCYGSLDSVVKGDTTQKDISVSGNFSGDAGGASASFTHVYNTGLGYLTHMYVIVDFGSLLTVSGTSTVNVHVKSEPADAVCNNGWFWSNQGMDWSTDGVAWNAMGGTTGWPDESGSWAWTAAATTVSDFRYVRLKCGPNYEAGDCNGWQMWIDSVRASNVASGGGPATEMRVIWMDVDSEASDYVFATVWYDDNLYLWVLDRTDFSAMPTEYDLGACTAAELDNGDYVAYPYTPTFDQDVCYVFGRWADPALGTTHLAEYSVSGGTMTAIEQGLGADHIGAFRAEGDTAGARVWYAVLNNYAGTDPPKLYVATEALSYASDIPFANGDWVYVDAMTVGPDGQVAVGDASANAVMIAEAEPPWTTWQDETGSFPITGGVSSLTYV